MMNVTSDSIIRSAAAFIEICIDDFVTNTKILAIKAGVRFLPAVEKPLSSN